MRTYSSHFSRKNGIKALSSVVLGLMLSTAFTVLLGLTTQTTLATHSQCSDGIDNDGNGLIDYPQDGGCTSLDDDYEGITTSGNFIALTNDKERASAGDPMIYVITLKQQRETARNVNVVLHLPFQANVVSASDGGVVTPGEVRWTNVSVYKNVTRMLTVNAGVSPDAKAGQYIVARAVTEGATATTTTLIAEPVQPVSDQYLVSVTDNREFILPGENLTWTLRVRNDSGRTTQTNVGLVLPYETYFVSNSDGGVRDSYNVTWKNVTFGAGEEKTFTATAQVDFRTANRYILRTKAYAGSMSALDQTVLRVGLPYDSVTSSITDHRETAEIGQLLTYVVTVKNSSSLVGTNVSVDASLPMYGEFVSATEGGTWDGSNVRWLILLIAPNATRTLSYTVRVRSDAPMGAILTAGASADGFMTRDVTSVVSQSTERGRLPQTVVFRKTADRAEAFPGSKILYTLYIRNTLDRVISDATILDRFDGTYLSLERVDSPESLASQDGSRMHWKVPVLQPGEEWSTTYVLSVAENAPAKLELSNIATLRGSDLDGISLTEKVRTNSAGVMDDIPATGAGMDAFLAGIVALGAVITAGVQRKIGIGKLFI